MGFLSTLIVPICALLVLQFTSTNAQIRGVNPCSPSPCGPGTYCEVNHHGAAVCRCLPGLFPKPDTITGCAPQCDYDTQCRPHEKCHGNKCVPACEPSTCGVNAICESLNHVPTCKCLRGYTGDPLAQCTQVTPIAITARRIDSFPTALAIRDPCTGNPCGVNSNCRNAGDRPVCSCLPGYQGDPYRGCRRGECESNTECPSHQVCQNFHCINPCTSACGVNANCDVRNHVAHCSCGPGYTGDPSRSCRIYDENELCHPSPCGINSNCRVESGRAICSCKPTFIGNPLSGCRHECETDNECNFNQACIDYKCKDPCTANACGQYAQCSVRNHIQTCTCPPDFLGDPYTRCFAECTSHADCPANRACIGLKCGDPCAGACGTNAVCRVDKSTHKAICSCPQGYTGHPFEFCRQQTPADLCLPNPCGTNADCTPGFDNTGKERPVCNCLRGYVGNPLVHCSRGECLADSDCGPTRVCQQNSCKNPCESSCGVNADCEVRNRAAVCSCPRGFRGDPFVQCTAEPYRSRRHTDTDVEDKLDLKLEGEEETPAKVEDKEIENEE